MRGCWEGAAPVRVGLGARTAEALAPPRPSIAWTEVGSSGAEPAGAAETIPLEVVGTTVTPMATRGLEPAPAGLWGEPEL